MAAGYTVTQNLIVVASAGTAVPLSANTVYTHSIEIVAEDDNTGNMFIGDSDVDNTATPRAADESITISGPMVNGTQQLLDLSTIFIDASVSTDGVTILYIIASD